MTATVSSNLLTQVRLMIARHRAAMDEARAELADLKGSAAPGEPYSRVRTRTLATDEQQARIRARAAAIRELKRQWSIE